MDRHRALFPVSKEMTAAPAASTVAGTDDDWESLDGKATPVVSQMDAASTARPSLSDDARKIVLLGFRSLVAEAHQLLEARTVRYLLGKLNALAEQFGSPDPSAAAPSKSPLCPTQDDHVMESFTRRALALFDCLAACARVGDHAWYPAGDHGLLCCYHVTAARPGAAVLELPADHCGRHLAPLSRTEYHPLGAAPPRTRLVNQCALQVVLRNYGMASLGARSGRIRNLTEDDCPPLVTPGRGPDDQALVTALYYCQGCSVICK